MATTFASELQRYLEQLRCLRTKSASEASLRDAFLQFLRRVFPRLTETTPLELEKHVPALRVRGGFVDALYGDLIFEFQRRLDDARRAEGLEQLTRYLNNQEHPDRYFGILSDGETLEVYACYGGTLARVDQMQLNVERAQQCKLWLDCYLFHEKNLRPTADDVALRFGERSPTFWHSIRLLRAVWQRMKDKPSVQTKFAEWQSLLAIVYGSRVGNDDLFLRHTYLALFARVLAFVALQRHAPDRVELDQLVTGQIFERSGLYNFITDDFFGWPRGHEETAALLSSLATHVVTSYDLSAINEDLLKELYQELVDPETRHDLGEFYTPDWLAELTLREAGFPPSSTAASPDRVPSLLDPACGSGTFLFTAVRLLRERGYSGSKLVEVSEQQLAGLDVHPLAVTIARTNFVLALGDDLRNYKKEFAVPIYMADSLNLPESILEKRVGKVVSVPVDLEILSQLANKQRQRNLASTFDLPAELADDPRKLNGVVDALLEFAEPHQNEDHAKEGFKARLQAFGIPKDQFRLWNANLLLMRWLLQPPATDTVWRFILKNACRPAFFAHRQFTFVAGNPPWLSYRYIQRQDYQDRVRRLALQRYKLVAASSAHLFTQMELATVFFAFCAQHYLADGGTLTFVMPRSILTGAKQHEEFRQRFVATAQLLIDCEKVSPLFNVPSCVVVWNKVDGAEATRHSVPVLQIEGELPVKNACYEQAIGKQLLRITTTAFTPPKATRKSPYFEQVMQGATIVPRCLWFVRPYADAYVIDNERPYLHTDPKIEPHAKKPWKGIKIEGKAEAEFLFATLLSDDMLPFGWRHLSLVVLPLVIAERRLIDSTQAFRTAKTGLMDWLRKADEIWKRHRKSREDLLDYLNWQGKLTAQRPTGVFKLLYNTSGTHLCACVVDARDVSDWQVYQLPVKGFVADTKTYWLELQRAGEAHYLCAVLNAPAVDQAIKPFQPKGAFGARKGKGERDIHRRPFEVLGIPRFNPKNKRHQALARLSQRCHRKVAKIVASADADWLSQRIGQLRQLVREALMPELEEIDRIVARLLAP